MQIQDSIPNNRKQIQITIQQANNLRQKAQQFQKQFQQQQLTFQHDQNQIYYIVSSQFLQQWRDFSTSHTLQRYLPNPMNLNILEDQNNLILKQNLKQGQDFQFISSKLFSFFQNYQGIRIKRKAFHIGNQKRVPVYLKKYQYLILTHDNLRQIDGGSLKSNQMDIHYLYFSEYETIKDFLLEIKSQQRLFMSRKMRLWQIDSRNIGQVWKHIKQKTYPIRSADYKIQFIGKRIQDQKIQLCDLQMQQNQFFVIQTKDQMKSWFLLQDAQKQCSGCYNVCQLKYSCRCNTVAYCTQQCKERNNNYHKRSCRIPQIQQSQQRTQMQITSNSSKGRVGLCNLGNTCFMNSCLQCLSNTLPLTEYFIKGYFQNQINYTNPIGTKGKLVRSYAKFIKSMWCDSNSTFSPSNIKSAVSSINPMFSGYSQHDSQQFFSFIVDGIHQDLNRVINKPYVETVDSNGRSDKVVSLQSWTSHLKRNQSIIVDLMTGQYKSKVTCPDCKVQSITFDPFITVTLPIPQNNLDHLGFYVIYSNMHKKTQRYYLSYSKLNANQWIKSVQKVTQLAERTTSLYLVSTNQNIYKIGRDGKMADILYKIQNQRKNLFLVQHSQQQLNMQNPIQYIFKFVKTTQYQCQNLWFKFPFFFQKNNLNGFTMYKKVLIFLYGQAYQSQTQQKPSLQQYLQKMFQTRPFRLFFKFNKKQQKTYRKTQILFKSQIQIFDHILLEQLKTQNQNTQHVQIDVRFTKNTLKGFQFENLKNFDQKMTRPIKKSTNQYNFDINQCFQNLREVQKLDKGNQWYCPKCKQHKQADKQLSIFKAPKILIIHLKRFKQKQSQMRKQKNQSKVHFPLQLNMDKYLIDPTPMTSYLNQIRSKNVYIEPKINQPIKSSNQPIYQLYAVSNHYGSMGGGHYTAYAKNNGKWFDFNDSSVRPISQNNVCTSAAYILFYKRKD